MKLGDLTVQFKTIQSFVISNFNHLPILPHYSHGLLSSQTDVKDILAAIAFENGRMGHQVVINTYAVIDFAKPLMFEASFLRDIAEQVRFS